MENYKLPSKRKDIDFGLIAVFLFSAFFTIAFSYINILKHNIFSVTSFGWEFIHLYEQLWKGKDIFYLTSTPYKAVIALIYCPLIFIFGFFYILLKNQYLVYVFQVITMSIGAVPVYLLARLHFKNSYLAFAFALSFLLHPVITSGAVMGYIHPSAGMPLLLFAFYFLERSKLIAFTALAVFAIMAKFDAAIMLFIYGVILYFSENKKEFGRIILKITFSGYWLQ